MTRLESALAEATDPPLLALPGPVADLLRTLSAPPRLAAHLRAVHDVAVRLSAWAAERYPALAVDQSAVAFGADTHDIGKVLFPAELSGPGSRHEQAGFELLVAHGVPIGPGQFARTHADWAGPDGTVEDVLVSLADKVWKAKRVPDLEQLLVDRIVEAAAQPGWQAFLDLDDELGRIADGADARLTYQNSYPVGV
jgi:hypothetical protein